MEEVSLADFISFFLNIPWKWNNLVSVRPNYLIFMGYLKTGGWGFEWTPFGSATANQNPAIDKKYFEEFLKQQEGENDHRNYFMFNFNKSTRLGSNSWLVTKLRGWWEYDLDIRTGSCSVIENSCFQVFLHKKALLVGQWMDVRTNSSTLSPYSSNELFLTLYSIIMSLDTFEI